MGWGAYGHIRLVAAGVPPVVAPACCRRGQLWKPQAVWPAMQANRRAALPGSGVWTSSTEFGSVGQPGGLSDGSRWSFRARGKTTTGKACLMVQHLGEGCQTQPCDDRTALRFGSLGPQSLQQVPGIVLDLVLFQKLAEFLFEGALAMMLLLRRDILPYRIHHAGADCEHRITLLPLKEQTQW